MTVLWLDAVCAADPGTRGMVGAMAATTGTSAPKRYP